ncbi:MAG: hypothetical protein GY758_06075 [Fuerstiella sp.]|jgi:hypothetical protein|nr:hypothetical protein [Fuerstiella sp.]MDG2127251.1 hypothetical protein [Fuerstiella sp.]
MKHLFAAVVITATVCSSVSADQWGLERGTPDIKSAGKLTFGPDDILFIGDAKSATVFAVATGNRDGDASKASINVSDLAGRIADVLGGTATINDLATNPTTGNVFAAVSADGKPAIVQIDGAGKLSQLALKDVRFSKAVLADAPADGVTGRRRRNPRNDAITDIVWYEGKVLVSGLRSGDAPSSVRELVFPFAKSDKGVGVQIYHAAHGRDEDTSAMRTFVPLMIEGKPSLLAAYQCTPLVRIPLDELAAAGERITATTVAELGNRNQPLDMISYKNDGGRFLLLSNSARGVMKISTAGLSSNKGLTERVSGGGAAGQDYVTIDSLQGVVQMDKLNATHAVVLVEKDGGQLDLKTVALP